MEAKKKVVIIDLDNTLFDTGHRSYLAELKRWDEFHSLCSQDTVVGKIKNLVIKLKSDGFDIHIMTGRTEAYKAVTERMLADHGIPFDKLFMRRDKDFRKDFVIKRQWIDQSVYCYCLAIDDSIPVLDMFNEAGITAFHPESNNITFSC